MATDSFTLGAMVDEIFVSYKRERPDIRERLPNRLAYHLSRFATRYPFWFLMVEPGGVAPGLFPFANPPVYTDLAESAWIDVGWFHTTQAVRDYYFSTPDDPAQTADPTRWRRVEIQTVNSLHRHNLYGGPPREIRVVPYSNFLPRVDWSASQGEPDLATLVTVNNQSLIRFNRNPDSNQYLYSVRGLLKGFPPFTGPEDTNPIFRYHPEIVRIIGCMAVAEMFRDSEGFNGYLGMLEGAIDPVTGRRRPGMIDELKQETRKRWQPDNDVQETYSYPPMDSGRGYRSQQSTGGSYYDPY